MSLFIRIELDPPAERIESLVGICPVNIFALRDGRVVVVDERQDECTLCELCLRAAPPHSVRIHKLYADEWLMAYRSIGHPPSVICYNRPRMNQLIVIPAYNEAYSIAQVLQGVREFAGDFDVVVVNDGSTDPTARVVRDLGIPQLDLPCNLGYARALQTGLRYAVAHAYETIVFMDADGQHDPRDVHRLTDRLRESGADLVIGSRFVGAGRRNPHTPLGRRIGMFFFSLMTLLCSGKRVYDTTSGFKALRARAARALLKARFVDFHAEVLVYLALLGYRIEEVPVAVKERTAGISMYSALSLLTYPLQTLLLLALAVLQARLPPSRKDVV